MSRQVLNNYYNQLDGTIRFGKSRNEGSVSIPFFNLVNAYAEKRNLRLVHQRDINGLQGRKVRPDGVLTNAMNLEFGIWESKDEKDDIRKEIKAKIAKGYPLTNTLFEDTNTAKPFKLKRVDAATNSTPRPKLKADKASSTIELDTETVLQNVSSSAWEYKLGNRSALEWILDQYKEKKPSDATIAEKFNTYRFADYKETVIDLLKRVCTVSVKTMEIINRMPQED